MNRTLPSDLIRQAVNFVCDCEEEMEFSVEFLEALTKEIRSLEPTCDHSVNICECEVIGVLDELDLAIQGKKFCRECGGCGHGDPYIETDSQGYDYETVSACTVCGGKGSVAL